MDIDLFLTNQSGIGRLLFVIDFYKLSFYMLNHLKQYLSIDLEINFALIIQVQIFKCRKPSPSMMLRYNISAHDIMIGDNETDMQAAFAAGINQRWLVSTNLSGPYTEGSINCA